MLTFIVMVFDFLPFNSIIIQDIIIRQNDKLDKEVYSRVIDKKSLTLDKQKFNN